jgi:hypothetical protein
VGGGSGLVPVVDMANHDGRYPQHTAKGLEEDGKTFVVLATERIKQGAQVCLTYGNLANLLLLPQFGFVLPSQKPRLACKCSPRRHAAPLPTGSCCPR